MSEDGLHVQAAVTLTADRIPLMRFQLPQSRAQIEVAGKIAWASESKKEAGIQFIDLPEDDRAKLREWIASEPPLLETHTAKETARERSAPPSDSAKAQVLKRPLPKPETIDQAVRMQPHLAVASRIAVAPQPQGKANIEVPRPAPALRVLKSPAEVVVESQRKPALARMNLGLQRRTWEVLAALIVIVAAISFSVGWFVARRGARNEVVAVSETKEVAASEPARTVPPAPASEHSPPSSYGVEKAPVVRGREEVPPATGNPRPVNSAVEPARPKSDAAKHPLASVISEVPKAATKGKNSPAAPTRPPATPPAPTVATSPAKKTAAPNPEKVVAQPVQASPTPPSSAPNPAESAPAIAAKEKETIAPPPAPKEPEIPAIPQGTVSVSSPPFPSIRVPAELKSQMSKLGTSLQIGQLISRVTPAYPEDVRRQRIEGTVKLHAIIGKDGAVQNVALLSGPALLAAPAINAILEWRFKPTLLGGQAIETEEDITVVFRLQNSAAQSS
jgi:protein TonB